MVTNGSWKSGASTSHLVIFFTTSSWHWQKSGQNVRSHKCSVRPNRAFGGSAEPNRTRPKTEPNRTEASAEPLVERFGRTRNNFGQNIHTIRFLDYMLTILTQFFAIFADKSTKISAISKSVFHFVDLASDFVWKLGDMVKRFGTKNGSVVHYWTEISMSCAFRHIYPLCFAL